MNPPVPKKGNALLLVAVIVLGLVLLYLILSSF